MKNLVKISLVLAAAALTLSGCNCFKKMGKKQDEVTYSCTPKVLTLNNGVVSADITVNFPAAYFNKKATLRLTPVIVFEGGEVAGTPKYVQGEKVNDNYTVISADNGGTYTQHVEFPYDDRMEQSELRVLIESKCNGASEYVMFNAATGKPVTKEEAAVLANPKSAEAMALRAQCGVFIAEGVNTMQKDFNFGDAAATAANNYKRTTNQVDKAEILYKINSSVVNQKALKENEQLSEFEKTAVANKENDRIAQSLYVNGYASPDGPEKFNDKLSMKLDLSFSNGDRRSSPYQGTIFNYMNTRSADIPNQFSTGLYNGLGLQGNNPVALMLEGGQNKNNTLRLSGAITLTYEPVEWLSLQGMLAPRYATTNKHNWKKPVTTYQDMEGTATLTSTPYATLTESGSRAFYGNYNFLMTFKKNFSGHDLKLILGAERNTYDYKYLSAYRQVFNYPDYDQIDVGEIENMDNSGHRYEWAIQSYFGRLNYNFKERYLLEANLRIDGSSRFSKSNRWGYFPSVSGAWRISEEPFMENAKHILDGLKIRASYGTLGNQNLAGGDAASYYPTTPNLALGHISMNGTPASLVTLNTLANPDIKWETTTMLDVGVDVTLFSKLNITADWYRKNTDDILMKLDIPAGVGLNAPYQNAGKVRNTGWELSIGYNNRWRDFTFGVQANVSDVKNEIVDMRGKTSTSGVLRNQEGYSIGSIYALESLGIIRTQEEADWVNENCPQYGVTTKPGDLIYADMDDSGTIDDKDMTIIGSTVPRYTYGVNLSFGWKGLNLSAFFQGVGKVAGYLSSYYVQPCQQGGTFRKEHLDRWNETNPNGKYPRLTMTDANNWKQSSFWMRSAAYCRLKNIQLSYTLPRTWLKKLRMKSAMVFVNAQNLFTITDFYQGFDPEVAYSGSGDGVELGAVAYNYPQVKVVTMGVELKF